MLSSDSKKPSPPFSSDVSSLIWPMDALEFVSGAMQTKVLFRHGDPSRLALLEKPLGSYNLRFLFAHGEESTIWKNGGRDVMRGTDSDRDVEALTAGITVQTHLTTKLSFGKRFISELARQMHLESGFFSIFASMDAYTATHYDRNYNFTIQLVGEKTWTVHEGEPAIYGPTMCAALGADRLSHMPPEMHGANCNEPVAKPSTFTLSPGDLLYIPPGYWHSTKCAGLSIQLNLSIEPLTWFHVVGGALIRHLETQQQWREPFGSPTRSKAIEYLAKLKHVVNSISVEDIEAGLRTSRTVHMDELLRRTLGSLLMWEKIGAGVHFDIDEVRFLATGTHGRWIDILKADMEPALKALAGMDEPTTVGDLFAKVNVDGERLRAFVQSLINIGYLTVEEKSNQL